jgi:hypothetical protein
MSFFGTVTGRVTNHKCDARCMYARGFNCNCSCGGTNHGQGFSVCETVEMDYNPAEFSLDGATPPRDDKPLPLPKPRPMQPALFDMYEDRQASAQARHVQPTLMDWLAENK